MSRVDVARVVPILSADMGYARKSLQERERWVEDGGLRVEGACEKVTCDELIGNSKSEKDPGICCWMSDPKLPNYVRTIFRHFRPH